MKNREDKLIEFVEKGADLEHERWARWQEYMFSKCTENEDGTITVPAWAVVRWWGQTATKYANLKEEEKESDREETRKYIPLLKEALQQQKEEFKTIIEEEKAKLFNSPNFYTQDLKGRYAVLVELDKKLKNL